jgi:hypothetical protein
MNPLGGDRQLCTTPKSSEGLGLEEWAAPPPLALAICGDQEEEEEDGGWRRGRRGKKARPQGKGGG